MSFWTGISQLRTILATETDYDSPLSEELLEQVRENIEAIIMALLDTGDSGSATSDPPDDATGVLTDTGAAYDVDEHNGRTLLITSGLAIGNLYTIDDTTATTLVCTGDNLYDDGVRSADTYKILYDLKVNADGHDHDGINSKQINASIDQAALKTTAGTVTTILTAGEDVTLPGGSYGFYPQLKNSSAEYLTNWGCNYDGSVQKWVASVTGTSYATKAYISVSGGTGTILQRYIQSSGEVYWIFIRRDKATKAVKSTWMAPDHPCFGNGNKPKLCPHPFSDVLETEEIVVINPTKTELTQITRAMRNPKDDEPDRDIAQVFLEDYDIDDDSEPNWPDVPVTVGLPADWNEAWLERRRVRPVKMVIPRPEGILVRALKKKERGII